jgi:ATP-binding cassette, subfamily B, bacterial PglK
MDKDVFYKSFYIIKRCSMSVSPIMVLMFINGVFEYIGLGAIIGFVSIAENGESPALLGVRNNLNLTKEHISDSELTQMVLVILVLFMVFRALFYLYVIHRQSYFGFSLIKRISTIGIRNTYRHAGIDQQDISSKLKDFTVETGNYATGVIIPMFVLSTELFMLFFIILYLTINGRSDILYSLAGIFLILGSIFFLLKKNIRSLSRLREASQSRVYSSILDSLDNSCVIKVHNAIDSFNDHLSSSLSDYRKAGSLFELNRNIPKTVVDLSVFLVLVSIIVLSDKNNSDMAELALYGVIAYRMIPIVNKLFTLSMSIRFYLPSVSIVCDIVKEDEQLECSVDNKLKVTELSTIEMINVSYSYKNENKILDEINVSFKSGSINVIVGKSGSGKSTLVNLLLGRLFPDSGLIQIDGKKFDTKDALINKFKVSFVSQSPSIFNLPVYSNISMEFDKDKVDLSRLYNSIDAVGLTEYVRGLDNGIDTILNRNNSMSGGEAQRIDMARAIYRQPSIIILDEPTSSLDSETERVVLDILRKIKHTTLVIMIAHKNQAIEMADRLIKLESGHAMVEVPG